MRTIIHPKLTAGRVRDGQYASDDSFGNTGAFQVIGPNGSNLRIVATDTETPEAEGWEHVSVSLQGRCPNWPEMAFVKSLFWLPTETVVEFHPPESEYISNHPYCLHLWRDTKRGHALPPSIFVGVKQASDETLAVSS